MLEKWKPVVGYEKYEVSSLGHIRRKKANNLYKVVHLCRGKNGYLTVNLCMYGICKRCSVANLVATAFVENPLDCWTVKHKNGKIDDNKASNLYWLITKEKKKLCGNL